MMPWSIKWSVNEENAGWIKRSLRSCTNSARTILANSSTRLQQMSKVEKIPNVRCIEKSVSKHQEVNTKKTQAKLWRSIPSQRYSLARDIQVVRLGRNWHTNKLELKNSKNISWKLFLLKTYLLFLLVFNKDLSFCSKHKKAMTSDRYEKINSFNSQKEITRIHSWGITTKSKYIYLYIYMFSGLKLVRKKEAWPPNFEPKCK